MCPLPPFVYLLRNHCSFLVMHYKTGLLCYCECERFGLPTLWIEIPTKDQKYPGTFFYLFFYTVFQDFHTCLCNTNYTTHFLGHICNRGITCSQNVCVLLTKKYANFLAGSNDHQNAWKCPKKKFQTVPENPKKSASYKSMLFYCFSISLSIPK